ncbi:MAG: hypothetical protein WAW13_01310 [Minisyncoccia bacterium]
MSKTLAQVIEGFLASEGKKLDGTDRNILQGFGEKTTIDECAPHCVFMTKPKMMETFYGLPERKELRCWGQSIFAVFPLEIDGCYPALGFSYFGGGDGQMNFTETCHGMGLLPLDGMKVLNAKPSLAAFEAASGDKSLRPVPIII